MRNKKNTIFPHNKAIMAPWNGKTTPHIIIEVNQCCNISCHACYKNIHSYSKPLKQIKNEIDYAFTRRNLSAITLAGGEPTLHPHITAIIGYCAAKGVVVNMLSNGVNLTDQNLAKYKKAGLSVIHVHVDSKQRRPDTPCNCTERDLNTLRDSITKRIKKHGMTPHLSLTLYKSTLTELSTIIEYLLTSDTVMGTLVTLYADSNALADIYKKNQPKQAGEIATSHSDPWEKVTNQQVSQFMWEKYNLNYDFYVASNKSDTRARWITYTIITVVQADGTYEYLPPSKGFTTFNYLLEKWYFFRNKKYHFIPATIALKPYHYYGFIILSALMSFSIRYISKAIRLFKAARQKGALFTYSNIYFQQLAAISGDGSIEICKSCPDATVRNGRLVPVCLADIISPIGNEQSSIDLTMNILN